jgi:hypothetical protein
MVKAPGYMSTRVSSSARVGGRVSCAAKCWAERQASTNQPTGRLRVKAGQRKPGSSIKRLCPA